MREAAGEVVGEIGEGGLGEEGLGEDESLGGVAVFGLELALTEHLQCFLGGGVREEEVEREGEDVLEDDGAAHEEGNDGHPQGHLPHLPLHLHAVLSVSLQHRGQTSTHLFDPDALLVLDVVVELRDVPMGGE